MNPTLTAIQENDMIFLSAQPDEVYFHWQVELYLYQFSIHGIIDRCYAVFFHKSDEPSAAVKELQKKYKHIICYKDDRDTQPLYKPLVRPYVLKKFFKDYSQLGKNVFYHDSDIFLVKLPKFELLLGDEHAYVSDTINYIGYNYLKTCSARYKDKHNELPEDDLFNKMCKVMNMSPDLIKERDSNSGGAQYLLKNIDSEYWERVEASTEKLFTFFKAYEKEHPIAHHVQSWATDMWAVLWEYWRSGNNTIVHDELKFSWATDNVANYFKQNIFHLAGINANMSADKFYKGAYHSKNVFKEYLRNPTIFDNISPMNATYEYVTVLKRYANSLKPEPTVFRFNLEISKPWGSIYRRDDKTFFGRSLWRSLDGKYTIFYNKSSWILTATQYESEFSEGCGGFASNSSGEPYDSGWNIPEIIVSIIL
jgi:hypothetical protein